MQQAREDAWNFLSLLETYPTSVNFPEVDLLLRGKAFQFENHEHQTSSEIQRSLERQVSEKEILDRK